MLKITIELLPFGFEEAKKIIGVMHIWNNLEGTKSIGDYGFRIFKKNSNAVWKEGTISGFKRLKFGVWDLLYICLNEVLSGRNSLK